MFSNFPFRYSESGQNGSIGISRFVIKDKHLIEYALVLPWPESVPQAQAIAQARAQARMDKLQLGLEIAAGPTKNMP